MRELKALLIALIKGDGSFEAASARLDMILVHAPGRADDCRRLLQAARKAGLAESVYAALAGQVSAAQAAPTRDFPETVVLDRAPGVPVGADTDPDITMLATDDPDATRLGAVTAVAAREAPTVPPRPVRAGASGRADSTGADHTRFAPIDGEPTVAGRVDETPTLDPAAANGDAREMQTDVRGVRPDGTEDETQLNPEAGDGPATDVGVSRARTGGENPRRSAAAADDATAINVALADTGDSTTLNPGAVDPDAARGRFARVAPEESTTLNPGAVQDDFDILDPGAMAAAEKAATDTGADWRTDPGRATSGAGVTRDFRENDKLRGRFELISKLGEGGMGAVWKGRDLLKVEARDRNPFVAIKLLQGDFKEHPEAFIALQRETSKQQRLAHPNIATVYDFDRDDATQTVFMTMEVLEGQPLDSFVRKLPADGLPAEEAMPLIEQLSAGLAYAHGHGLVHSDLKPGNCFLTREGALKLLDFGIARASKTKSDAEGETTLFDPGQLGALTPTYATIEMFEGQDPDQRDDIYALAIMSYQLLTGRHPYGKKSAPKALELGLTPAPVDKLTKRQNRGLARALAFEREDRTPSVDEFLADMQPRQGRGPLYAGIGLTVAAIIGALSIGPVTNYMDQRRRDEIATVCAEGSIARIRECLGQIRAWDDVEQRGELLADARVRAALVSHIARGDEASITEGLDAITPFDARWQQGIREEPPARDAILELYQSRISAVFAPDEERYDYRGARRLVDGLDVLFPDSARVLNIGNGIRAEQQAALSSLADRYNTILADGRLISRVGEEDISDVLGIIAALDPEHRLLTDDRLRFRFSELADEAFGDGDFERANALLVASTAYAPDDPALNELRFQVETELTRIANARRVAEVEGRLESQIASLRTLADFQGVRDDLLVLTDLSPENAVLTEIRGSLEAAFTRDLRTRIDARDWAGGEQLIGDFAKLLELPYLTARREALSDAEREAGFALEDNAARVAAIDARRQAIDALLAEPGFADDWELRLKVPYKELIALLAPSDPRLGPVREAIADVYLQRVASAREAGRFAEALALIAKGQVFHPALDRFGAEEQRVAVAREALRLRRAEEARIARVRGLKEDFQAKAANDQVQEAKAMLAALAEEQLAGDDTFLTREAPRLLAEAYMRLALAQAEADNYIDALTLARAGLESAPALRALVELEAGYAAEVEKRRRELALRKRFDGTGPLATDATRAELVALRAESPERYDAVVAELLASRARQLENLANARSLSVATLAVRAGEFTALFPDAGAALADRIARIVEQRLLAAPLDDPTRIAALATPLSEFRSVSRSRHASVVSALATRAATTIEQRARSDRGDAYRILVAARSTFGDHAAFASLASLRPPPEELIAAVDAIEEAKLTTARKRLAAARARDANHPDLAAVDARLGAAEAKARAEYETYAREVKASKSSRDQKRFDAMYTSLSRLWTDNPEFTRLIVRKAQKGECTGDLAGFGRKRGGTCYDLIGRRKGPEMVVVPAGGGVDAPFAIGKYEVTVEDFNLFCNESGACKARPANEGRLPVTGISRAEAERYAAWLSEQASRAAEGRVVYRLPTVSEWEYAARADGTEPEKKFNCRVTSGGNIIAGHALVDARSGRSNSWGLTNYVGNAQEWARAGSGLAARGGTFQDPLAKCEASITRGHDGNADALTGFRLVRELG